MIRLAVAFVSVIMLMQGSQDHPGKTRTPAYTDTPSRELPVYGLGIPSPHIHTRFFPERTELSHVGSCQ